MLPTPVLGHSLGSVNMGTSMEIIVASGLLVRTASNPDLDSNTGKSLNLTAYD